ncbi:MAG: hypothetical protein A3G00_03200 [Candidatus Magasanikbacteria bacterium RIFCSPLOWO2_12_FULL_43_12]|uniref:Uncharacterized protein n=1 Tax=Candidatus Magasanikbacteria bacterium RIFCSPLOWO2_12_FULL_43_12 TaxID=1798692 RepID=A0A1F6MVP7_9BACT|nr:MAG: hypothetical protein A3G00_03200 [Candidatus Magasanikbacteria bacterium RIFCSPLOWO2_12_FULL_43_12]
MTFKDLRDKVLQRTPIFRRILNEKGNLSLLDFFKETADSLLPPVSLARQEEFFTVLKNLIDKYINPAISGDAIKQLRVNYRASTTDHHGPLTHPFFSNSHFVRSLANEQRGRNCVFVFSVGGVSLNNSSFPRGFFFHNNDLGKECLHFFSLRYRQHPVFALPRYQESTLDAIVEEIDKNKNFSIGFKERLKEITRDVCLQPRLFSARSYSEQITYLNYCLWKKMPGQSAVNLIYLEQENIVNELLLAYHLGRDTALFRLLTDESALRAFEKYFDGIAGAFSSESARGTILFWAIQNGRRKRLIRDGLILASEDGEYRIALEPTALREAILKKEIMPSMALTFIVLSFYYGLSCGGGFLQVSYLTAMKEAYRSLRQTIGAGQIEIDQLSSISTDYFCGEFVLGTLSNQGRDVPATPFDFLLYANGDTAERLRDTASKRSLNEAVDQMMPELYKIVYGKATNILPPKFSYEPTLFV